MIVSNKLVSMNSFFLCILKVSIYFHWSCNQQATQIKRMVQNFDCKTQQSACPLYTVNCSGKYNECCIFFLNRKELLKQEVTSETKSGTL